MSKDLYNQHNYQNNNSTDFFNIINPQPTNNQIIIQPCCPPEPESDSYYNFYTGHLQAYYNFFIGQGTSNQYNTFGDYGLVATACSGLHNTNYSQQLLPNSNAILTNHSAPYPTIQDYNVIFDKSQNYPSKSNIVDTSKRLYDDNFILIATRPTNSTSQPISDSLVFRIPYNSYDYDYIPTSLNPLDTSFYVFDSKVKISGPSVLIYSDFIASSSNILTMGYHDRYVASLTTPTSTISDKGILWEKVDGLAYKYDFFGISRTNNRFVYYKDAIHTVPINNQTTQSVDRGNYLSESELDIIYTTTIRLSDYAGAGNILSITSDPVGTDSGEISITSTGSDSQISIQTTNSSVSSSSILLSESNGISIFSSNNINTSSDSGIIIQSDGINSFSGFVSGIRMIGNLLLGNFTDSIDLNVIPNQILTPTPLNLSNTTGTINLSNTYNSINLISGRGTYIQSPSISQPNNIVLLRNQTVNSGLYVIPTVFGNVSDPIRTIQADNLIGSLFIPTIDFDNIPINIMANTAMLFPTITNYTSQPISISTTLYLDGTDTSETILNPFSIYTASGSVQFCGTGTDNYMLWDAPNNQLQLSGSSLSLTYPNTSQTFYTLYANSSNSTIELLSGGSPISVETYSVYAVSGYITAKQSGILGYFRLECVFDTTGGIYVSDNQLITIIQNDSETYMISIRIDADGLHFFGNITNSTQTVWFGSISVQKISD